MRKRMLLLAVILTAAVGQAAEYGFDLRSKSPRLTTSSAAPSTEGILRSSSLAAGATAAAPLAVGDALSFRLFDDVESIFTLRERTESPLGGETFLASADGGDALVAVVMQDAGGITVTYTDCDRNRVYTIVSTADGVTVREMDPNAGVREPCPTLVPDLADAPKTGLTLSTSSADQSSTLIDVLVAFDRNAVTWARQNGGGITNFATMAVQKMNTAMANTGFSSKFRFRLVGAMAVDAETTSLNTALNYATDGTGNWVSIKAMRETVGADIVTVLIDTGSASGTTGLGWSLDDRDVASFSEHAYNVCAVRAVAQSHTMTHETGHNLGAGHSDTQSSGPGPQRYTYSSGYYFTVNSTQYHTIMAYGDKNGDGYSDATAIPYFSSPDYTYEGVAVGDATHDNVKTINQTYAAASKWRAQKIAMSYDVIFSPESGSTFTDSITVTLTPGKAGLPIRYTLDGSTPTISSTPYTSAITLTKTTTIRAVTITDGVAGPVFEATYSKSDLGTGVDAPQLTWRTDATYPWTFQTTETYDGVDALRSAEMPTGSSVNSWLEADVTGPTKMSFAFKRGYMYSSTFSVTVDGTAAFTFSESGYPNDWKLEEIDIPSGKHVVKFNFNLRGYYRDVFNGIYLDQVRFDALSRPPTISPTSTMDESTATTFTGLTTITLTPPAGKTGALYYTIDDTDPTGEGGKIYTEPITLTKSSIVRAVFVEGGKDPSAEVTGLYLERHTVKPGEWTTDVAGVKASAAKNGRLICVMRGNYGGCGITQRFYDDVACTEQFLSWAEANGIYLVRADSTTDVDYKMASSWFSSLMSSYGDSGTYYYTRMYFAWPSAPMTAVSKGGAGGNYVKIGTVDYAYTTASAIAGFASVLGETVPSTPTCSSSTLVSSFPVNVTLTNPNGSGTIYYTLDGTAPAKTNGKTYTGAIAITKSTTLKAAVWPSSGCSSAVLVLPFKTIGDALGTSGVTWSTGGDYAWEQDAEADATMKTPYVSGKTYSSWLQATVSGKGKLVFTLKAKSNASNNTIKFSVGGSQKYSYGYNGSTSQSVTMTNDVTTTGTTTFKWTYAIANSAYNFSSCGAWLSNVQWIPDGITAGGATPYTPSGWSTPLSVDNDWLIAQGVAKAGDATATVTAKLAATGANGLPRYQSYILGLAPDSSTPAEEQLKATIDGFDANGKPIINFEPTPNEPAHVSVKTLGRTTLPTANNTSWPEVSTDGDYKFFKIKVEVK